MVGWGNTHEERGCLACLASAEKRATCHGAGRYSGPVLSQARGTKPKPTSRPTQLDAFYSSAQSRGRGPIPFHASWCPRPGDMAVLSQFFETIASSLNLSLRHEVARLI